MDESRFSITPHDLYDRLGTAASPIVIDVRRAAAFDADDALLVGAIRRDPDEIDKWRSGLDPDRTVVVYCVHGHEVSQIAAAALRSAGSDAWYLGSGIAGWVEQKLPLRRKVAAATDKWITRARPKIDRIACPWLIRRFVDPNAAFLYVPAERVFEVAGETGAIPYDISGAEPFSHDGERCSFDGFIKTFGLSDPALDRLALIVRGADTGRADLAPQSEGLLAISRGLSANYADDLAMLEQGMVVYDALYVWCRSQKDEIHGGRPAS